MKKNKVVFAAIVAALSVMSYSAYQIYGVKKRTYNLVILENVEALAAQPDSPCSATANCYSETGKLLGSVSCSGTNPPPCEAGYGYVICNGLKSTCAGYE